MDVKFNAFKQAIFDNIIRDEASATAAASLAFLDSIHDFWPERGTKSVTDEDEDEPEELDENRLKTVHDELVGSIQQYVGRGDSIEQIMSTLTNGNVTSVHGVEDKTLAFFKKTINPFNGEERVFTINDILTKYKFTDYGSNWENYSAVVSSINISDSIEIQGNGRSIKSLTDEERGHIAFFILAYLNPQVNPGSSPVGLTFDMSPRDVGKIFNRINQVHNAIYPQNVSDSASTSFSALLGRSIYYDVTGKQQVTTGAVQEARTNAFTIGKYRIAFIDRGFGKTNKFGFSIRITDMNGTPIGEIPFGPRSEQGPSVNYLMDIISSKGSSLKTAVPKIGTVAKLNNISVYDKDLLFDLKRLGDQEQMLVAGPGVYTVTGDRFAHAFRRLIRRSGIYHSVKGLRISRFGSLTPEQAKQQSQVFRLKSTYEKLKIVGSFSTQYATAGSDLNTMRNHILFGIQKGYVFSDPIDIPNLSPEFIDSNYTKIGSTFATLIARYRMIDILNHIETLRTKLEEEVLSKQSQINEFGAIIEKSFTDKLYDQTTENALNDADLFLIAIEELRTMNITFDADAKPFSLYTQLFEPSGRMIKGVTNSFFNFSTGPFTHPESGLASIVSKLLVNRKARRPEAVKDAINKLLVQYFISRDLVKEAFFDKTFLSTLEAATDISIGLTTAQVVGSADVPQGQQGIIQVISRTYQVISGVIAPYIDPLYRVAVAPAARGGVQLGGDPAHVLQYRDIHELFVEICSDAAVASESGDDAVHALDNIEAKWMNGINEIRQQALDEYRSIPFEESLTTDLISYILSFRTLGNVTDIGVNFNLGDRSIFPSLQENLYTVPLGRAAPVINDIGGILLKRIPVQKTVLEFLMKLHTVFDTDPYAYSAPDQWRYFWTQFYSYFGIPLAQVAPPRARRSEAERLQLWSTGRRPLYTPQQVKVATTPPSGEMEIDTEEDTTMRGGRRPLYG